MQTSCDMGGRHLSSDGGKSWIMVPLKIPGIPTAAFDPVNDTLIGGNQ